MYIYIHVCICVHTHVYICIYIMCTYISYVFVCTYIYVYVQRFYLTSSAEALYTQLSESMRVRECIRANVCMMRIRACICANVCMKASVLFVRTYYQTSQVVLEEKIWKRMFFAVSETSLLIGINYSDLLFSKDVLVQVDCLFCSSGLGLLSTKASL